MIVSKNNKKVYVGMSGGVDSSVAAYLLKKEGYDVLGVYLLCYSEDEEICRAKKDMEDARAVAQQLDIPFYVWNLEKEYKEKVIDYMIEGYQAGITPNPDVMCNREIKFGIFLRRALAMGADFVATGHYVRLRKEENFELLQAKDQNKDQSYFLWTLTQEQLKNCLFPIGNYLKSEVREIASKSGLVTANKKDSQGVCFVGKVKITDFLSSTIIPRRGKLVTTKGEIIGEHNGSEFYTIGQRHLGVSNAEYGNLNKGKDTKPHYVVSKNIKENIVTVAEGDSDELIFKSSAMIQNINFVSSDFKFKNNELEVPVLARIRYRQPLFKAILRKISDTQCELNFAEPVKFVAPGQSAVFYKESGEMIGGGIITS